MQKRKLIEREKLKEKEKGITLVALVVTIIVLLILASVTLAMIVGENGIIAKAREAKEKTEKAAWEERIDLAIIEAEGEKRNPTLEDVIDKLYDNDIIDDKENDVDRETGAITTNEPEYVIEGKLDDYLDNQGGEEEPEEPPVYEEGNITFSYNPTTMTNKDVEVTITKNVEEDYTIEYSKYDTNSWQEYTGPVDMEKNGAIYARLKNSSGSSEKYATGNVANIDKLPPNEPTLQIGEVTENSIQVTASSTDQTATSENANSGIKGYRFSKDNGESWEPSMPQASGSYTFTGLTEDTTYNIKVKAIDNAGNETISTNATTQKTETSGISAGDIISGDGKILGAEVKGYECINTLAVNKWLIFYADENNIYLIADDYVPYKYIPAGCGGTKLEQSTFYGRAIYFDHIARDYDGSSDITDERIKALNNDYFSKGYKSSESTMCAVAYMLDTSVWRGYAGNKADYAIGGPSIELLLKSYNKKHGTSYQAQATSNLGYKVSFNNGSSWVIDKDGVFDTGDPTYVITSINNSRSMILSSPSAGNYQYALLAVNNGRWHSNWWRWWLAVSDLLYA